MKISMLYDSVRWEEKSLMKSAESRGIQLNMVNVKKLDMDLSHNLPESLGNVTLQRCTSYYRGLHSTAYLEFKGQKVLNDLNTQMLAGNKMLTSLALSRNGLPIPRTCVSADSEIAMKQFSEKFNGKAVLKPVSGSWGRMIALMNDFPAAMAVLEDRQYMYPLYSIFYMQEYVNRPPRDIRVVVVGDRAVGAIYRYQSGMDWRTNTAIGGRAEKCEVTGELEDLAVKAAESVGKGIFGVDILESENGYLVNEVNSTTEFRGMTNGSNVDVSGAIMDYAVEMAS